eukprot:Rhum_TRINITY_DN7044_c1_g1::Rhum_TRINITY_DN7044_c1_g1_i1::g.21602::m.21602/K05692/ACTB_G1; actin beta/gamma 1
MKLAVNTAKLLRNVPLPDEIATVHDAAVVVDLGSGNIRVGFSGDDAPRYTEPCIEGRVPRGEKKAGGAGGGGGGGAGGQGKDMKESYVCSHAYKLREKLDITHPIKKGVVQEWGDPFSAKERSESAMEKIFTHLYEDLLKTSPQDPNQPLLLSESVSTDLTPAKENRERMTEMLFEGLGIPSLYIAQSPVLSLYSSGRTTGTVMELGFGTCHTAPIFEGFHLYHSMLQLDFGGNDLTSTVLGMMAEQGTRLDKCHERFIAQYVKETLCQAAEDSDAYEQCVSDKDDERTMALPDGTKVRLDCNRWSVVESLFRPSLLPGVDCDQKGIHHLLLDSIRKCDTDIAGSLFQNVVVAGGTSMTHGLHERIETELTALAPNERIKVHASTERSNATWIGGSILSSLPTFQDLWVTKADYEEYGQQHPGNKASIIHRNCF